MESGVKTSPCRGCGKPIVWAITPGGGKIPLDPRPAVYILRNDALSGLMADRAVFSMVTHFATCSKARAFSASKKAQCISCNGTDKVVNGRCLECRAGG